jgi:sugar lactone lactonase YvrE
MTGERFFALGAAYELAFAPDETALFVVASRLQRWDLVTGKRTHSVAWAHGSGLDVSPDGARVAVINTSGDVALFDAATMEQLWVARGRDFGEGPGPLFVAAGEALVTASWSGHLVVRAAATGDIVFQEHHEGRMISGLACSPDRTRFALAGSSETHVRRWPFAEHAEAVALDMPAQALALDGSGRLAVQGHGLTVVDVESGTVLATAASDHRANAALAWAPDGELAAVQDGGMAGFAGDTLERRWSASMPYACAVAYSPSGALLALGGWERGEVLRRSGSGPVVLDEPPDDEAPASIEPRDDEEEAIIGYVEIEADEGVVGLEKVDSKRVGALRHDIWDVRGESTRWWAITGRALAAYDQQDFPHADVALSFHVGIMMRLDDGESRFGDGAWRHWDAAAEAFADATDASAVPAIAAHLLEALAAAAIRDPLTALAPGLREYLSGLASAGAPSAPQVELALESVRQLLRAADAG